MSGGSEIPVDTRERELFLNALERSTPQERLEYLEMACADDAPMRQRIVDLLKEHDTVGEFLEGPALETPRLDAGGFGTSGTAVLKALSEKVGDRIGRYKLLQQIGEGGCGVVYMAEQEQPVRRRVALKVIKLGMDTKSVIARFEAERQALALMDHPNIAKVLDAGATETGRPYFVMELVRGVKITTFCDEQHLSTEERLKLFGLVCQAIQHAHQKGIIHRDIKPSNILVTLHDGVPVPKVIDFGIAKATEQRLTDKTLFTEFSAFIGTPAYMSPEQAEMSGLDIDTRSDIYSLGVLLYELLTGKTPFDPEKLMSSGLDECRRTIREEEPVRPSTRLATMVGAELTTTATQRHIEAPRLVHLLKGDLDWIVMKALEKDRARRYETANGLGLEIQRYLDDEPVLARPPSNVYRLQKLLHRHRGAVAAVIAVVATLLIGAVVSAWQAVRATHAEHDAKRSQREESELRQRAELETKRAESEKNSARLNEYVADISLAAQKMLMEGNYGKAMHLLNKHQPKAGEPDLRGFEWRYLWQMCQGDAKLALPLQDGPIQAVACSPDGRWLAVGVHDKVSIWRMGTQSLVATLPEGAFTLAFLPDGKSLVTGAAMGVRVWRTGDWGQEMSLPRSSGAVALSPDGAWLATESDHQFGGHGRGGVRLWNTTTWEEKANLPSASAPMVFSPDGKRLAAQTRNGVTIWELANTNSELVLQNSTNLFFRPGPWFGSGHVLAFSPDGKSIVGPRNTISDRGVFVLSIWDARTGEEIATMPKDHDHVEHTGIISGLAFSPDATTLATASWDHSIHLWDFAQRTSGRTLHGHLNEVWAMAYSADGKTIVSGSKDGAVKFWSTEPLPRDESLVGNWEPLAFSRDGTKLAVVSGRSATIGFFDLRSGEIEKTIILDSAHDWPGPGPRSVSGQGGGSRPPPPNLLTVSISADLGMIVQGMPDGVAKFWNVKTGETNTLKVGQGRVDLVLLSPDAKTLVTGGRGPDEPLRWWNLRQGTNGVFPTRAFKAWFSPDGLTLATHQREEGIELWDASTHALRRKLNVDSPIMNLAWSPDSQTLATTTGPEDPDNAVRLWEVGTGKLIGVFTGHKQAVWSVAFAPDGATLATASDDSTVRIWNVQTQQELLSMRRLGGGLRGLQFSPDGQFLVGASGLFSQKSELQFFRAPLFSEIEAISARTATAGRAARQP